MRLGFDRYVGIASCSALTLLMFSGDIKSSPLLRWIPVDLTAVALVLVGAAVLLTLRMRGAVVVPAGGFLMLAALVPGFIVSAGNPYAPGDRLSVLISMYTAVCSFVLLRTGENREVWIRSLAVAGVLIVPMLRTSRVGTLSVGGAGATISAAQVLGVSIIVLLMLWMSGRVRGHLSLVLVIAVLVVLGYEVIGTGSRGPTIALTLTLFVVVITVRTDLVKRAVAVGLLAVGAWGVLLLAGYGGAERMRLAASGSLGSSPRVGLWRETITAIPGLPFGCGWGNFYSVLTPATRLDSGYAQHAHNTVLEAFVEGGWVAGLAISGLIVLALRRQLAAGRRNPDEAIVFAVGLFLVMCSMVSGTMGDDRAMFAVLAASFAVAGAWRTQADARVESGVAKDSQGVVALVKRFFASGVQLSFPPRWIRPGHQQV